MAWDREDPPAVPPDGVDPVVWALARRVCLDHQPDRDGFCVSCKQFWPCEHRANAAHGLLLAVAGRWEAWPVRPRRNTGRW